MQELIRWSVKNGVLPPDANLPAYRKVQVLLCAWSPVCHLDLPYQILRLHRQCQQHCPLMREGVDLLNEGFLPVSGGDRGGQAGPVGRILQAHQI